MPTVQRFSCAVYTSPSTDRTAISVKGKTKGSGNSEKVSLFLRKMRQQAMKQRVNPIRSMGKDCTG